MDHPASSAARLKQQGSEMAWAQFDAHFSFNLLGQKLQGPRGPLSAQIPGRFIQKKKQPIQKEQNSAPIGFYPVPCFTKPALNAAALGTGQVNSNSIHEREVLLNKFGVLVTTKRIQEASRFNTARMDPTAHSDPYSTTHLIPID